MGLDFAINEASKRGIRVVLVFANYWAMYGGIDQYNIWSFEAGSGARVCLLGQARAPGTGTKAGRCVLAMAAGYRSTSCGNHPAGAQATAMATPPAAMTFTATRWQWGTTRTTSASC